MCNYGRGNVSQPLTRSAAFTLADELCTRVRPVLPSGFSVAVEGGVVTFSSDVDEWIRQGFVEELFDQPGPVEERLVIAADHVLNAGQDFVMEVTCDLW